MPRWLLLLRMETRLAGMAVVFPPGVGISWNPMGPLGLHEPPHGVIAGGAGLFGGVGFSFHSPPSNCGCQ